MASSLTHPRTVASAASAFDPFDWIEDWKAAGGSFASVDGRLILGSTVGGGENNQRLAVLIATLAGSPGAKLAVAEILAGPKGEAA